MLSMARDMKKGYVAQFSPWLGNTRWWFLFARRSLARL
jgi:hypothetical protein